MRDRQTPTYTPRHPGLFRHIHLILGCLFFFMMSLSLLPTAMAWSPLVVGGQCVKSRRDCRSTIGNAGGAGACCDPLSGKILHCASNDPCSGGRPYKWFPVDLPLKWNLYTNNLPDTFSKHTASAIEKSLQRAWDGWTRPACTSFRHQYLGQGAQSGSKVDIQLPPSQLWAAFGVGSGTLAFATPRPRSTGALRSSGIYFNPSLPWGVTSVTSNQYDFTEVAHHEIGHAIGFAHSPFRSAVMYFQAQATGSNYNGPQPDDIEGICTLYPLTGRKACSSDEDCAKCGTCQGGQCITKDGRILCPCQQSSECAQGLECRSQVCQKPGGGEDLDFCSSKVPCKQGYHCLRTPQGHVCLRMCGKGAAYPPGSPGSACRIDGSCPDGNECHLIPGGRTICLHTCQQQSDCANGGECLTVDFQGERQGFCLCSDESKCKTGQTCNNSYLGGPIGVCTAKQTTAPCRDGFECRELPNKHEACLPKPGKRRAGETCDKGQACRDGLLCALTSASAGERRCVEDCTSSNICQLRGECRPVGQSTRQCYCNNQSQCGSGRTCELNLFGRGVCTGPPNICGNSVCEPDNGETCASCSKDCNCPSGTVCNEATATCDKAEFCGNSVCEASVKEDCGTCPQDCKCAEGLSCQNGTCSPEKTCGDNLCSEDLGENCSSCAQDCGCPEGQVCQFGLCIKACGDGNCNASAGENCSSCPKDCPCDKGQTCQENACSAAPTEAPTSTDGGSSDSSLTCAPSAQKQQCDADGKNCTTVCTSGCGCDALAPGAPSPLFFLLFLLLLARPLRRMRR